MRFRNDLVWQRLAGSAAWMAVGRSVLLVGLAGAATGGER